MDEPNEYLDLHLTVLAQWLVRRVGVAILLASVVGGVVAVLGAVFDDPTTVAIGIALGVFVAAGYLATADAPFPPEAEEAGEE